MPRSSPTPPFRCWGTLTACATFTSIRASDAEEAIAVAVDAKTGYPSACDAGQTLVHEAIAPALLPRVAEALQGRGDAVAGDDTARKIVPMAAADGEESSTEYGERI